MNIYLIGFMGSGKSEVGRALKAQYGRELLEMDAAIESREKKTISDIFREQGEAAFREMETALLQEFGPEKELVISCGGGAAMRECNVQAMKERGKIVLLCAAPETILERVRTSHDRPLLENRMNVEAIREMMEARRPRYEAAADLRVDTDGKAPADIAGEIMERLLGQREKNVQNT